MDFTCIMLEADLLNKVHAISIASLTVFGFHKYFNIVGCIIDLF